MKRKLTDLKPNEAILIENKKQAKKIAKVSGLTTIKKGDYVGKNNLGWWCGSDKWNDDSVVFPASDFLPKKKSKTRWMKVVEKELARLDNEVRELQGDKPQTTGYIANIEVDSPLFEPAGEPETKLEAGRWYRAKEYPLSFSYKNVKGNEYGFDVYGKWATVIEQPLTELPEKWAVAVENYSLNYINKNGKKPPYYVFSEEIRRDLIAPIKYAHFPAINDKHTVQNLVQEGYTLLSPEDFKRLVVDAQPKEIDWSVPGQLVINQKGLKVITYGQATNSTFNGAYIPDLKVIHSDPSQRYWEKSDFKLYAGEPITLGNFGAKIKL